MKSKKTTLLLLLVSAAAFACYLSISRYFADGLTPPSILGTDWVGVSSLSKEETSEDTGYRSVAYTKGTEDNKCLYEYIIVTGINGADTQYYGLSRTFLEVFFQSKSDGTMNTSAETLLGANVQVQKSDNVAIMKFLVKNDELKSFSEVSHFFYCTGTPEQFAEEFVELKDQINQETLPNAILASNALAERIISSNPSAASFPSSSVTTSQNSTSQNSTGEASPSSNSSSTSVGGASLQQSQTNSNQSVNQNANVSSNSSKIANSVLQTNLEDALKQNEPSKARSTICLVLVFFGSFAFLAALASIIVQVISKNRSKQEPFNMRSGL